MIRDVSFTSNSSKRSLWLGMPRMYQRARPGQLLVLLERTPGRTRSRKRPYPILAIQTGSTAESSKDDDKSKENTWGSFFWKVGEGSGVTITSLLGLGLGGFLYNSYYKQLVLDKIENAFSPGYSSNELVALGRVAYGTHPSAVEEILAREYWIPRVQQPLIDAILDGSSRGRYHLIVGEKGTGKTSLLLEGMRKVHGDGIAMLEAHDDVEVFRTRLGKAIDYEFHEDYVGSLFSIKGPRDTTALLDIERALNKLEKVALKLRKSRGRPLVLIINNIHLFRDDVEGTDLLELLQQRAEIWAAKELVTMVLTSDEYWTFERLRPRATNMYVHHIPDIPKDLAVESLAAYRRQYHNENVPTSVLDAVYNRVGGRLIFLSQVARSDDMLEACKSICEREKTWLLNQCWIFGKEMDDDVEDHQKYCAAAMVLAKALVEREKDLNGTDQEHILPEIPLHEARQIMTRADFMQKLDHINIFAIDSYAKVRADSVPMQIAFREICGAEGFEAHLQATLKRLDELESLARTREITIKDLWNKGNYQVFLKDKRGEVSGEVEVTAHPVSPFV
ncbi:hypothetical protein M501DRAFT_991360 [Patellaria atrata CBS 101060]|uniref:Orc1-like AAA ATPase domain-containing protein n=1 Tax=Patellaria atrata CBS 101060 TaxID=1346257 RepID=A0A9P4SEH8_9PEZI|nr:hypothetical protein M501DRAFT_991360 [Patellaria atrata CBS 101060]